MINRILCLLFGHINPKDKPMPKINMINYTWVLVINSVPPFQMHICSRCLAAYWKEIK